MNFLLGLLNPRSIAVMLALAVAGYFGVSYWHRGAEVHSLEVKVATLQASLKSMSDAAKACTDGVTDMQKAISDREAAAKKALDQAKKEGDALRVKAQTILIRQPLKGDVSKGFADSADDLLNQAIDERAAP